jgi:hypothetical protein
MHPPSFFKGQEQGGNLGIKINKGKAEEWEEGKGEQGEIFKRTH